MSPLDARTCLLVSPHLDDAVLSAGGVLAERAARGLTSIVLTVCAGRSRPPFSAFANHFHAECGLGDDAVAARRDEDREALHLVGARAAHGDVLDAVYRRGPSGEWLYDREGSVFGPRHPLDCQVASQVRVLVGRVWDEVRPGLVIGPLGIGAHVDHLIVRDCLVALARERSAPLLSWEDQPYLAHAPRRLAGTSVVVPLSDGAWADRMHATARYVSQVPMLFESRTSCQDLLLAYARSIGTGGPAERFWRLC